MDQERAVLRNCPACGHPEGLINCPQCHSRHEEKGWIMPVPKSIISVHILDWFKKHPKDLEIIKLGRKRYEDIREQREKGL
jgi:hypothetical protein